MANIFEIEQDVCLKPEETILSCLFCAGYGFASKTSSTAPTAPDWYSAFVFSFA